MAVRVLQVVTYMGRGGLESMLMNYYRRIDRTKVQFDFLTHRFFQAAYDTEILKMGGNIYHLPKLNPVDPRYKSSLNHFFTNHPEYKIVHSHLDCMAGVPLKYAAKHQVPIRIAHAHNAEQTHDLRYPVKMLYKKRIPIYATDLLACGKAAGEWMFGTHTFSILNNAIDAAAYTFHPDERTKMRRKLGLDESVLLVGHVGRFRKQKNHAFLLQIFQALLKKNENAKLLLVGDGEQEEQMKQLANKLGIQDEVIFAGSRGDVSSLLQAMDVFCLPSLYEGLPLSVIEAQAAGLPCLVSDAVSDECKITDLVRQLSLHDSAEQWADELLSCEKEERKNTFSEICSAGFDVGKNAETLQKYYLEKAKESE